MTARDVTPEVKTAVSAYLLARAFAKAKREQVDEVKRAILAECPLTNGAEQEHGDPPRDITDPDLVYLCTDDDLLADFYAETHKRLLAAGIKPADMPLTHCPALVAESLRIKTAWALIDAGFRMLGEPVENGRHLYGKNRAKFLDLIVGLVVNLPDFKSPLDRVVA